MTREEIENSAIEHRKKIAEHNDLCRLALADNLNYITPELIGAALQANEIPLDKIRLDVLEVLGNTTGFGAEDEGLCAFIAFEGDRSPETDD